MYEPASQRVRIRALTVVVAVVAAVLLWAIVEYAFGLDMKAPASGTAPQQDISLVPVIVASVFGGLVSWGLLALLERFINPARTVWLALSLLGLVLSLGGPLTGTGVTTGNRIALLSEHLLVGIIVIGGLYRTARPGPRTSVAAE
ncbi:MAG: DUF6069 family protein [Micromonosporaceae bacterium]